jgi:hypothetical protein
MPLAGRQMSKKEVAKLMYDAGWTDAINLPKMIAVAYAESNLYTEAYHVNDDGTTDWGYLQLNDQGVTGLELAQFKEMALDPVRATAFARSLWKTRGFQPWVAYNSGSYREFIPAANVGVGNLVREKVGLPPT